MVIFQIALWKIWSPVLHSRPKFPSQEAMGSCKFTQRRHPAVGLSDVHADWQVWRARWLVGDVANMYH